MPGGGSGIPRGLSALDAPPVQAHDVLSPLHPQAGDGARISTHSLGKSKMMERVERYAQLSTETINLKQVQMGGNDAR